MYPGGRPHVTIRASAGSGKTYQLSTRYLRLVSHGADVGSVLATTFTRKAAGEVLGRVITRLADAATVPSKRHELAQALGTPLNEKHCRTMLLQMTRSLHRLSISTIDGFFHRIAQSFSYELNVPLRAAMIDESHPVAAQLRRDAIEAMLADEDLPGMVSLLRQLHHDSAARTVTDAIDQAVLGFHEVYREAPDKALWCQLIANDTLDRDELNDAIDAFSKAIATTDMTDARRKAFEASLMSAAQRDWERFIKVGPGSKLSAGEMMFSRKPIEPALALAMTPLVNHAKGVLIQRVANQTSATHDLMQRFDRHYAELRHRQGVLLFSDLTHKLARELPALGDGLLEDIYFRLDSRVAHLLLDEFQDTSLAQWDVLRPFALEIAATADGTRSLFCVGDTKQAIYGWRGGVAELFDRVEDELGLDEESKQTLSASYRSSEVVLGVVNRVFESIDTNPVLQEYQDAADRWRRGYQSHEAVKQLPGHATLETSLPESATNQDDDDAEPVAGQHERYVAGRVKELVGRPGGAGSIGVLVSTNAAAARLIHELAMLGVDASGEGGSRISDSPVVQAVMSALIVADHPGDRASAFHVMNSPIGRLIGLDSIHEHEVWRVSLKLRRELITLGYAGLIAKWAKQLAGDCDEAGVHRLTQLIRLADDSDMLDVLRPSRFASLIETHRQPDPSSAAVRVMTIHGSKGLEFDTVVLAELDKRLSDRPVVLIKRDHPTGPVTGVYRNPDKHVRALDSQLETAWQQHSCASLMEDLCGLYVAMTRAKQALHMIVKPRKLTKSGKASALNLSFASILRTALFDGEESYEGQQVLFESGDPDWTCADTHDRRAPLPPTRVRFEPIKSVKHGGRFWPTVRPSSKQAGTRSAAEHINLGAGDSAAMNYGTMVHAWFERVGFIDSDPLPDDPELREIASACMPDAESDWIEKRIRWFREALASKQSKDLLQKNGVTELWRERPFAVRVEGGLVRGVFDRVTVTRDDTGQATSAMILDYKTDVLDASGSNEKVQGYHSQLRTYRRALKQLLNMDTAPVALKLWFVGTNEVVDVK